MALPSLASRLSELHAEMDRLLTWSSHPPGGAHWTRQLNELRFVRATLAWETFLEESCFCYLRGARSVTGHAYALAIPAAKNLAAAEALAVGGAPFGKWLNEKWTLDRATKLFTGTHPYAVLYSPTFPEIRGIRNRIVHRSESVRKEFQKIVTGLYGTAKPGMTPGRLLTDAPAGTPRVEVYLTFLKSAGSIIAN